MTPIESMNDIRLLTLIATTMDVIEDLAFANSEDPDYILARALYRANKSIHEYGESIVVNKLLSAYPLLNDTIA